MKTKYYKSGVIWGSLHANDGVRQDQAIDIYFDRFERLTEGQLGEAMDGIIEGYERPRQVKISDLPDKSVMEMIG